MLPKSHSQDIRSLMTVKLQVRKMRTAMEARFDQMDAWLRHLHAQGAVGSAGGNTSASCPTFPLKKSANCPGNVGAAVIDALPPSAQLKTVTAPAARPPRLSRLICRQSPSSTTGTDRPALGLPLKPGCYRYFKAAASRLAASAAAAAQLGITMTLNCRDVS